MMQEQQTPLHIASRLGNVDIVVLLLQSGAQVDAVTKGGNSATVQRLIRKKGRRYLIFIENVGTEDRFI